MPSLQLAGSACAWSPSLSKPWRQIVEVFNGQWFDIWPFSTENWHSSYSCPGECPCQFWFFYVIFRIHDSCSSTVNTLLGGYWSVDVITQTAPLSGSQHQRNLSKYRNVSENSKTRIHYTVLFWKCLLSTISSHYRRDLSSRASGDKQQHRISPCTTPAVFWCIPLSLHSATSARPTAVMYRYSIIRSRTCRGFYPEFHMWDVKTRRLGVYNSFPPLPFPLLPAPRPLLYHRFLPLPF